MACAVQRASVTFYDICEATLTTGMHFKLVALQLTVILLFVVLLHCLDRGTHQC
jgi:hypothetical protein